MTARPLHYRDGHMTAGGFLDFATLSTFGATEQGGVLSWRRRRPTGPSATGSRAGSGTSASPSVATGRQPVRTAETVPGCAIRSRPGRIWTPAIGSSQYDSAYGVPRRGTRAVHRAAGTDGAQVQPRRRQLVQRRLPLHPEHVRRRGVHRRARPARHFGHPRPGGRPGRRPALEAMGRIGTDAPELAGVAAYAEDPTSSRAGSWRRPGRRSAWSSTPGPRHLQVRPAGARGPVTPDPPRWPTGRTRCWAPRTSSSRPGALRRAVHRNTAARRCPGWPSSPTASHRRPRVTLNLDLRSPDEDLLARADAVLRADPGDRAGSPGRYRVAGSHRWGVRPFPAPRTRAGPPGRRRPGAVHRPVSTVAGHDSVNLSLGTSRPLMLFVPSVAGISHNEGELTHDDDALAGVELLPCGRAPAGSRGRPARWPHPACRPG
ncbi:M20 family metallo-hydrolase [Pseudonocardia sp. MCCB 268]|nr:M20 family metallo-hydrolase [Pseudonocardia cytotoxica]